jgi:lysophospholipase L1-like esterase
MGRQLYQYHPVIGYVKMPDMQFRLRFSDGAFRYRTNHAGFRGNGEFVTSKAPGTKRVLVYGDSFTEGGCVPDGVRYTDRLSDALGAEVYNLGISGTGTDQQYLIHREIGSTYEHDLIVIAVWMENIRRNVATSRVHGDQQGRHWVTPKPYFELGPDGELQLRNQPVPRPVAAEDAGTEVMSTVDQGTLGRTGITGRIAEVVDRMGPDAKRLAQRISRWQPYPEYEDPEGLPWQLTRRILERWCAESATPVVIVPIPVYQYIERTSSSRAARDRFAELHAPPKVRVHDPLPDLWSHSPADRRAFRFANDHHFTPAGHQALADSLEPVLREALG